MENKFFEELSRRLREGGIESSNVEDKSSLFLQGMMPSFCRPGVKTRRPVNCITGWQGWRMRYMSM